MGVISLLKNLFSTTASDNNIDNEIIDLQKLNESYGTMPLSLGYGQVASRGNTLKSRDVELLNRFEMYEDAFVRGILDVKIGLALGATDSTSIPYTIKLTDSIDISDEYRNELNEDFKYIRNLTLNDIKTIAKDSEAITKGFCKVETEEGKGITSLLHNHITNARYIKEIKNNRGDTVAFEVAIESKGKKIQEMSSRKFVSPTMVCCLNAESNGFMEIQSDNIMNLENMNPFNESETYYEDFLYGGSFEGVYRHYKKYQWALEALFNARVSSTVVERFIIHNLDGLGAEEVATLKKSLMQQIKNAGERLKKKVTELDPMANTLTTYIPTAGDINSVRIEDSEKNYNLSIDDVLIHIKTFIGAIGYNLALTSYGENERGGLEESGTEANSIIMDAQSDRIRDGVSKFLKRLCEIHVDIKYGLTQNGIKIDTSMIEVTYVSITNKSQLIAETQRLQSINNSQQMGAVLEQFKGLRLKDDEGTRKYLKGMIRNMLPQNTEDIDMIIDSNIEYILEAPVEEEI